MFRCTSGSAVTTASFASTPRKITTPLHWLGEALKQTDAALRAYALMTDHVHLLLTPKKAELVPVLLISLGRRYVQYVNSTYRRTGTLWDSRYKSSLIQAETYLLDCMRCIEFNPVRAESKPAAGQQSPLQQDCAHAGGATAGPAAR